jgi:holliday junction DNA helicase RuvA
MITHIEGKLVEKNPAYVVIDCAGVGYLINISLNTFSKLSNNENCKLLTHLAIREDAHTLFGFFDEQERHLFRHLISVSGVGANTARMVLSSLGPAEIQQAILTENATALQQIKGIGGKTAQRIIIDLKDKLQKEGLFASNLQVPNNTIKQEALSALVMLGFSKGVAEKAVDAVLKTEKSDIAVEHLIKLALKNL